MHISIAIKKLTAINNLLLKFTQTLVSYYRFLHFDFYFDLHLRLLSKLSKYNLKGRD